MTSNDTKGRTMDTVTAIVKRIVADKNLTSGFVIDLLIIDKLQDAGLPVSQDNISLVNAAIN
jgi:hypothetical protein